MNYEKMIKHRNAIQSLSVKNIETICVLNEQLQRFEKVIVESAEPIDKALKIRIENSDDLLVDYNLVCEISFPLMPVTEAVSAIKNVQSLDITGSDWTENLKGISALGSNLGSGKDYNTFLGCDDDISKQHHCWLFHILYTEFRMSWKDICRVSAIWSDLEITHHYCVELLK